MRGRTLRPALTTRWLATAVAAAPMLLAPVGVDSTRASSDLAPTQTQIISVFDQADVQWVETQTQDVPGEQHTARRNGRVIERIIDLPEAPASQRDAQRIICRVEVEPALVKGRDGRLQPGDFWTRLGSVVVVPPGSPDPAATPDPPTDDKNPAGEGKDRKPARNADATAAAPQPVELMRFITGFGGEAVYEQDVTALAPLLSGRTTIQVMISTFRSPAWKVTVSLTYSPDGVGYRRPVFARGVLFADNVMSTQNVVKGTVVIPTGVAQPRMVILSTGHATDGTEGDEFVTRTNILRIDRREVARWRPWAEEGGTVRGSNPASGRKEVDGRLVWSSDVDRSGWHPGMVVKPMRIPLPELTPGTHEIELEVLGIRPKGTDGSHGYWRISGVVVADEPWPDE